jgi:hypothetical protein
MRKVCVQESVRMVLRALMLMNVQKRRLQERKRQHQVHQDGNARSHTHIVPLAHSNQLLIDRKLTARPKPSDHPVYDSCPFAWRRVPLYDPLKLDLQTELHPSWRLRRDWMSVKRRTNHANVCGVILVIQHVEGVDRQSRSWSSIPGFRQHYGMRQVEIQIDVSGPMQGVSRHTDRTIERQTIMVVVVSGRNIHRLPRVKRESCPEVEPLTC